MVPVVKEVRKPGEWETWLVVLVCTSLPVFLALFFFYKWHSQKSEFEHQASQFTQRQNTVLAYDAMEISRAMSALLDAAAHDVRIAASLSSNRALLANLMKERVATVTAGRAESGELKLAHVPLYRELVVLDSTGEEKLRIEKGVVAPGRKKSQCGIASLCDVALREDILKSSTGNVRYGKLMRYYTPQSEKLASDAEANASLSIATRTPGGAVVLGLDYVHLRELQNYPVFPYRQFSNPLLAYEEGNYAYLVDSEGDFLTHPKHWHAMGVDRSTGNFVPPVQQDSDQGTHPLNVLTYKGEKLQKYFERLRTRSFRQKSVDIFQAPNLKGTSRILSVAPILLREGQFESTGIFGHIIVGCSVDYFEEPKEKYVPYY